MRPWSELVVVGVCVAVVAAAARPACADPVTIRVSEVASGSFDGRAFTDRLVTLEAHFTTEDYLNCIVRDNEGDFCDTEYYMPNGGETATVEGLGTLPAAGGYDYVYVAPSSGPSLGVILVGDGTNGLGIYAVCETLTATGPVLRAGDGAVEWTDV